MLYSGGKDELADNFRRITGGRYEISASQRNRILGYHETSTGFEGLIKISDSSIFKQGVFFERATIEQIMIALHKGEIEDD